METLQEDAITALREEAVAISNARPISVRESALLDAYGRIVAVLEERCQSHFREIQALQSQLQAYREQDKRTDQNGK